MKRIIPAIDLYNGNAVRLYQGDFKKIKIYEKNPLKLIRNMFSKGVDLVHIVNLNGAKSGEFERGPSYNIIESLIDEANKWGTKIQLGGGIRNENTIKNLLEQGLHKFILGTIAVEKPTLLGKLIVNYRDNLIVALDVMNSMLKIKGWMKDSEKNIYNHFLNLEKQGVSHFIITDISRDGTLSGSNVPLYKKISSIKQPDTKIIASGGICTIGDINQVLVYADGVIIGKALYNDNINFNNLKNLTIKHDPSNLTKRIIPCLDVKDGRVVKGVQFNNLKDSGDPVELAKFYNDEGADEIVFLDITATLEGRESMLRTIRKVAEEVYIPFTVGGGIKNIEDITNIIKAGAEKVSINTSAVKNPKIITDGAKKFGSQSIVVAIDVKRKGEIWEVYIKSGTESTGIDGIKWAQEVVKRGAGELLVTSMDKDGTQTGYDLKLIESLSNVVSVPIIASGGAGNYLHFFQAIKAGAEAVLAASLFHRKQISIIDLKQFLWKKDIKIRI